MGVSNKMRKALMLLLTMLLLIIPVSTQAAVENLVQNPGFEEGQGQDVNFWIKTSWQNNGQFSWDGSQKHSGERSGFITNSVATDSRYKQEILVKENSYYRLSCWIKAEGVGQSGKGGNISIDGLLDTSRDINGSSDWEQVELFGKTGKDQKSFYLTIGLGGYGDANLNTGKVWFDDITVEKLDKTPAGVNVINLFNGAPGPADTDTSGKGGIWIVFGAIFAMFIAVLIYFVKRARKSTGTNMGSEISNMQTIQTEGPSVLKIDRRDIIIMISMTLIYAVISLVNLGSTNVPQTSWKPARAGESIVVDLGKKAELSRLYYYGGLGEGAYRVEYLQDNGSYAPLLTISKKDIFIWKYENISNIKTDRLKLIVDAPGSVLNELGIFENGSKVPLKGLKIVERSLDSNDAGKVENLFDEQNSIDYKHSYLSGMIFDEIYHARTAYEYINHLEPFEWTHPPLGKIFISIGIMIFGMNPFGWRIMGTLFGIAMIPIMYLFGKKIFGKSFYGFCTAFLMTFDFMHYSQTRLATIDVYGTFFVILMYYYMYDYFINKSYVLGFKNSLKPLALCGLFFGMGAASKWIGLYAGGGLALLFLITKYSEYKDYLYMTNNKKAKKQPWLKDFFSLYINGTVAFCILFFVVIPGIIYVLSYIPYMSVPGPGHGADVILRNQVNMLEYHSKGVLGATHPFSSHWWEWPIIRRPLESYLGSDLAPGMSSSMVLMGNPAIWWMGILAVLIIAAKAINRHKKSLVMWGGVAFALLMLVLANAAHVHRLMEFSIYALTVIVLTAVYSYDKRLFVILMAMTFQYITWVRIERITFIYHFFSTLPFLIICIVYIIKIVREKSERIIRPAAYTYEYFIVQAIRYSAHIYLIIVAILFVMFYPVLSGIEVPRGYVEHFLLWFKGHWVF
jgi:dolichyl-phosphate-mannose-protein mannosyltransferase